WDSINEAWAEMRVMTPDILAGGGFASFVDWVKKRCSEFRGAVDSSLLRDDGFAFIELGKWIERADATARLLDVKYHVLLPSAEDVGGGLDYMQWQQILRAANSLRAYRYVYRKPVTAEGVVDFLVLNEKTPRSLKRCYAEIVEAIEDIGAPLVSQKRVYIRARRSLDELNEETAAGVLSYGLHEWLTETIVETNTLAGDIGTAYGFTAPVELQE
ncbi:MAG: alpha-E domain-containing protein, partial [Rubricella sp.]